MKKIYFLFLSILILLFACNKDEINIAIDSIIKNPQYDAITLVTGTKTTVDAYVLPYDATNQNMTWQSSNSDIASVNNKGEITAISIGSTTVSAITADGKYGVNWTVNVIPGGAKKMIITRNDNGSDYFVLSFSGMGHYFVNCTDGLEEANGTLSGLIDTNPASYIRYFNYAPTPVLSFTLTGENIASLTINNQYNIELDLCNNIALTYLDCSIDQIGELDVTNNIYLANLACSYDNLNNLNLRSNTLLKSLYCPINNLTDLDLTHNPLLTTLNCDGNNLDSLILENNPLLVELSCGGNNLKSLDLSKNIHLKRIEIIDAQLDKDALNSLFSTLPNNTETKYIYIGNNPGASSCDKNIAIAKGWTVADWLN